MSDTGLSGRLSEFNLEEILQLIALQQKTGLLRVEAGYPMALYFEQGLLVSYRDRRGSGQDPLETFLKSYGFFTHSAWEHIEFVQKNADLDLTEILINEGLLDADGLAAVELESAQEYLHLGMTLREGRYQFLSGRAHLGGIKGRVRMKADGLLMEAVRRIDEMPSHIKRFHRGEATISRSQADADVSKLSSGVQRVWSLLDQERPARYLIANGRMSEFDLYTTLEALRELKLIEIHAPEGGSEFFVETDRRTVPVEEPKNAVPALALSALSVIVLAAAWLWIPAGHFGPSQDHVGTHAETWREEAGRAQIEAVLDLYYGSTGRYPTNLGMLRTVGLLSDDRVPERVWQYRPSPDGSGYELERIDPQAAR
jgi:hypothetical protein